jgi:hypothetical protein
MGCCSYKKKYETCSIATLIDQLNNSKIKDASGKIQLIEQVREEVFKSNYFLSPRFRIDSKPAFNRRANSTDLFHDNEFKL